MKIFTAAEFAIFAAATDPEGPGVPTAEIPTAVLEALAEAMPEGPGKVATLREIDSRFEVQGPVGRQEKVDTWGK